MGGTPYNFESRVSRAEDSGYYKKSNEQIFTQSVEHRAHPDMLIHGKIRECVPNADHPNPIPIIISLDVTGSMGNIPRMFIQDGLPTIVSKIIQAGVQSPQICFTAIGDHKCDRFPFQAGQFEANDELLDNWLTKVYLEGNGGANDGESYALAWKFATDHTSCDYINKGNKGFLFSIGDEPNLRTYSKNALNTLFGGQNDDESDLSLFEKASKTWNMYHIFIEHGNRRVNSEWSQLFGTNLRIVSDYNEIPNIIAEIVNVNMQKPVQVQSGALTNDIKITL